MTSMSISPGASLSNASLIWLLPVAEDPDQPAAVLRIIDVPRARRLQPHRLGCGDQQRRRRRRRQGSTERMTPPSSPSRRRLGDELAVRQSFSVSSGTILNRSPTRPKSATWKIGASSSLLIATMVFEVLHAGEVLDRAGNADRDVDVRARRSCRSGRPGSRWARSRRRPRRGRRRPRRRACRRAGRAARGTARCEPNARPPETMIFGAGEFGALALRGFETDEAAGAGIAGGIDLSRPTPSRRRAPPSRTRWCGR